MWQCANQIVLLRMASLACWFRKGLRSSVMTSMGLRHFHSVGKVEFWLFSRVRLLDSMVGGSWEPMFRLFCDEKIVPVRLWNFVGKIWRVIMSVAALYSEEKCSMQWRMCQANVDDVCRLPKQWALSFGVRWQQRLICMILRTTCTWFAWAKDPQYHVCCFRYDRNIEQCPSSSHLCLLPIGVLLSWTNTTLMGSLQQIIRQIYSK